MELTVGMRGTACALVTQEATAQAVCSGELPVYATPCMAALMEQAAWQSVAPCLDEGFTTVGVSLHLSHDAATPVGRHVRAESELTAVDGRMLTFSITAYDESGVIGSAEHRRCIIRSERFLEKAETR